MAFDANKNHDLLEKEPINKLLFKMAGPSTVAMLMQALYNTVDSMYVAKISDGSLAAVTLAFPVQMIIGALSTGIGIGINSSISRNLGAKKDDLAGKSAANGLALGILTVLVVILFGLFGSSTFVNLYSKDPNVVEPGIIYIRTICLLAFGSIFSQLTFSVLQGSGNMFWPMVSQLSGGVFVIFLDPLFIFTFGLGVRGAAIASSIAQMIAMSIGFYAVFVRNRANLKVSFRGFRPDIAIIKDIMFVGIPAALTQATTSIVAGIVNKQISNYGTTAVSVYGAYAKLCSFAQLPVFGITRGMNPILGYCCGNKDKKRFMQTVKLAVIVADSWTILSFAVFMIFPEFLLKLMSASDEMMELGVVSFRLLPMSMLIFGATIVMTQLFAPVKKSYISMTSAILRQVLLLVPLTLLFSSFWGINGIWIGICAADYINFGFIIIMNIWLKKTVINKWELERSKAV